MLNNLILTAISDGINIRLLLIATGLDRDSFMKYVDDDLFSSDQRTSIRECIKDWRRNV